MLHAGRSRVRIPMRWIFFFNLPNPSSRSMALRSTQPLTEMSTRNLHEGKGLPARKADNLTYSVSRLTRQNVGVSTSHNHMGLHSLLTGIVFFFIFYLLQGFGSWILFHPQVKRVGRHLCSSLRYKDITLTNGSVLTEPVFEALCCSFGIRGDGQSAEVI
jgi:hypothetical protein